MDGFNVEDPLNRITGDTAAKAGELLSKQIDVFVRAALAKVVSPDTLAFFVETRMPIPQVDLIMTFNTPHSRSLEVLFKNEKVASVRIDTEIQDRGINGVHIVHVAKDLVI